MKTLKRFLLLVCALLTIKTSTATQLVKLTTGVDDATNAYISGNDDTWQIMVPSSSVFQPAYSYSTSPSSTCSKWVTAPGGAWVGPGNVRYRAYFNVTGCSVNGAQLIVNYTNGDDKIPNFNVNGIFTHTYPAPVPGITTGYIATTSYVVNIPASAFVPGTNYIEFIVYNYTDVANPTTPTGFNLCGNLEIDDNAQVEPSITGPDSFCDGQPLVFTGSDGPGTASYHHWEIYESDQWGNPTNFANSWVSPNINGSPGSYMFPSFSFMQCGKHYLIKLVVTDNCASAIADKVIYINCPPAVDLGPDQAICDLNGCITLSVPPIRNHTASWTVFGDEPVFLGHGWSITVCPTQTTTYCVTVIDNLTGCHATDCITIYYEPIDPGFSYSSNTSNASYFTFTATPNVTTVPAGFDYQWIVEVETAPSVFTVIADRFTNFPNCWSGFPGAEAFDGFNHISSIYNDISCNPNPGRFKYNTTYRITRGVWSEHCPWKQNSVQIRYVKSNGGIVVTEDKHAPDLSWTINQAGNPGNVPVPSSLPLQDDLSVYPNPASDLVNIVYELEENASGVLLLTDISGKQVSAISLSGNEKRTSIDMSGYRNGVYFIHLHENGRLAGTKKIIVSH